MNQRLYTVLGIASCFALTALLLSLPACSGAAEEKNAAPGAGVPDAELTKIIDQSTKILEDSLKGDVDKKGARTAEVAALMIAACAQRGTAGAPTPKDAALRDAALKIVPMIKDGKYEAAQKEAKGLAKIAPGAAAKDPAPIVDKVAKVEDIMSQFSGPRSGGLGVEQKLEDLEDQKDLKKGDLNEELLLMVDRATLVADLVKDHVPDHDPALWKKFATDMRKKSADLTGAIRKGDAKAAYTGVVELNKSCAACHEKFK